MTDKEMLQEALEWQEHIKVLANGHADDELYQKRSKVFDWFIEQAERVQELEEEVERYQSGRYVAVITKIKMDELEKQNKRYREALEFYADMENYKPDHYDHDIHEYISMINYDNGATARKALEGTK